MSKFSAFFNNVYSSVAHLSFDVLVALAFGGLAAVFLAALLACAFSRRVRLSSKKPFFCLVNAFTAVALSVFTIGLELSRALAAAALFWLAGYLLYGVLCAVTVPRRRPQEISGAVISSVSAAPSKSAVYTEVPAAKNSVRLDHALSIADKLLLKNLGKGDRQELEKMKTTLAVLQIKGALTPQEGEILNDSFNALLKLMAKYNV